MFRAFFILLSIKILIILKSVSHLFHLFQDIFLQQTNILTIFLRCSFKAVFWLMMTLQQMIQIGSDKGSQKQVQEGYRQQSPSKDTYIVFRIIYASILIAFLLLISFYFDLLSDYDALSLVLGFVVCIILQFFFLSYYFRHEMKKYKIDEIGVLKWKIKLIFGELNQKHIDKKNKIKYYRHEANQKDRLFHKDNQQIYQNVMSFLRGKEQPNFTEMIAKTKIKWNFLEEKMLLLERFMGEMQKQYDGRRSIYNRYKAGVLKIKDKKQYKQWQQFLKEQDKADSKRAQLLNNTSFYSQYSMPAISSSRIKNSNSQKVKLNWQIFNWFILQKAKINEKQVVCLKENIIKEYNIYIRNIKQSKENNSKIRDRLLADFKTARDDKNQIVKEIERISIKYSQIKQSLQNNRIKQGEDVEAILKKEFDLRLQKIELQNFEIKISRAQSLILYTSELLYNHLQQEQMELEDHLNKLNSKFTNYLNMMAGIGQTRTPIIKKYFEEEHYIDSSSGDTPIDTIKDFDTLMLKYGNRRKCELTFKNYLIQVLNLFKEMSNNHNESQSIIQQYKPRFQRSSSGENTRNQNRIKKEISGARLHYYASNVKDLKILKMFQKINSFECKLTQKVADHLLRQSNHLSTFEDEHGLRVSKDIKKSQEEVKRREEEFKKLRRRSNKEETQLMNDELYIDLTTLKDKLSGEVNQYLQIFRISTTLVDIIEAMIENQNMYEKYAIQLAQEEQFERSNQLGDSEDARARLKHTAYVNCIEKQQNTEFDDDSLLKDDYISLLEKEGEYIDKSKNQVQIWSFANYSLRESLTKQKNKEALKMIQLNTFKESTLKSIEMVNRLLGVFFNEWSKSQFFHEFVKEELLTSLNRKKPDIVEHLNIEYFKIIDRVKTVGPIKHIRVHNSQIYRCLFDIVLDFKGRIAVQIGTKLKISKKPALQIKLLIKQFQCPIRLCFTPYSLGKSYASLLERPKLSFDYSVTLGGFNLTKIPFFTQIIKTYIVLKLRKKMLWPKRMTLPVPLAYKSTLDLAILQRNRFERDREKFEKKTQ